MEGMSLDGDLSSLKERNEGIEAPVFTGETTSVVQPLQDGAKSSVDVIELPTGYLDDEGVLHKDVEIKEMTGEEEDILASAKTPMYSRMNRLLENCVVSIGKYSKKDARWKNIIRSLSASDRIYLILQLRILSLGPVFASKCRCPECDHLTLQNVDLNHFKVDGLRNPLRKTWEIELPSSKKKVTMKALNGWSEEAIHKQAESKDRLSIAMLGRIVEFDGKQPVKINVLKTLGWKDRSAIREAFKEEEGDMDTSIEYSCGECGAEVNHDVDIGTPNFFFPSEASKS